MVQLSSGRKWIKSSDVTNGDAIVIESEGAWQESATFKKEDGSPVKQFVIDVAHNGDEKMMNLNKVSRENLVKAWGRDTEAWVNRIAIANKVQVMVAGAMKDSIVLTASDDITEAKKTVEESFGSTEEVPF